MGHAGAIVSGSAGTAQAKKEALEAVGVKVGKTPSETARLLRAAIELIHAHRRNSWTGPDRSFGAVGSLRRCPLVRRPVHWLLGFERRMLRSAHRPHPTTASRWTQMGFARMNVVTEWRQVRPARSWCCPTSPVRGCFFGGDSPQLQIGADPQRNHEGGAGPFPHRGNRPLVEVVPVVVGDEHRVDRTEIGQRRRGWEEPVGAEQTVRSGLRAPERVHQQADAVGLHEHRRVTEPGDPESADRAGWRAGQNRSVRPSMQGPGWRSPRHQRSLPCWPTNRRSIAGGRWKTRRRATWVTARSGPAGLPLVTHRTVPCSQRSPRSRWRRGREA